MKPEIKSSLIEAISVLNSFDLAEHEITVKLQVQERLKSELQRQRIRGPLSDRLEQLRNKKNRLIQLNRLEDQNIAEETERLTALKKQNLLTEKKMESTSVLSNESASSKEKRRMELIQELENLKKSKEVREQLYEDMRQQTIEHTKPIETTDQKETKLISTIESISLYTNHLELVKNVLDKINQPNFKASIPEVDNLESQCKLYLQTLKLEIATQSKNQTNYSHWIQQIKSLCNAAMPDNMFGKTAGKILELLLSSADKKIPIRILQEVKKKKKKKKKKAFGSVYSKL